MHCAFRDQRTQSLNTKYASHSSTKGLAKLRMTDRNRSNLKMLSKLIAGIFKTICSEAISGAIRTEFVSAQRTTTRTLA